MENLGSKRLSNFAKIIILLLIALFIGCIVFNIKAIKEGALLTHEEIVTNNYVSNNGNHELLIKNKDTLRFENTKDNTTEVYTYVYSEGVISIELSEDEKYQLIFLNSNRLYFLNKNMILYLTD